MLQVCANNGDRDGHRRKSEQGRTEVQAFQVCFHRRAFLMSDSRLGRREKHAIDARLEKNGDNQRFAPDPALKPPLSKPGVAL